MWYSIHHRKVLIYITKNRYSTVVYWKDCQCKTNTLCSTVANFCTGHWVWRWWMWMVAGIYWRTHTQSRMTWSEGWRPPGAQSAFIKWTGWSLSRSDHGHEDSTTNTVVELLSLLGRIVDAVYCYRPSSVVCHISEPCKNGWTDRDAIWVEDSGGPREPCSRWGSRSPHWEGAILRGKGALHCEV